MADAPQLALPLKCQIGQDCWISNYVDDDSGQEAKDYRCGGFASDGHSGIDFAVRDLKAVAQGVDVLAAAPGTVRATRDQLPDVSVKETGTESVKDRECGNGVAISHADGWETQYCHMKHGSIAVKPGDKVAAGQRIGSVGLSGLTEYPHVHMTVRHEGQVVDPFLGTENARCGEPGKPLWSPNLLAQLVYRPGTIFNYGLIDRVPKSVGASQGDYREAALTHDSAVIVLWMQAFGVRPKDAIELRVIDPTGKTIVEHTEVLEKRQALAFRYIGRKKPADGWPPGVYRGILVYKPYDGAPGENLSTTAAVE